MFGRSQVNQHPFFAVNQLLVSNSGLHLVPEKGLLSPKWGVCHVSLQNHLFPGHGPKLYIPCQVGEIETKVELWEGFFLLLANSSPKVVACCFHILCAQTDRETGDLGNLVPLSRFLLNDLCWPMLLAKNSVHLGGSSQGPQVTGQFTKCWPDLLHGFLAACGCVSPTLACVSCYNLIFFQLVFRSLTCSEPNQLMFTSNSHMGRVFLQEWEEKERDWNSKAVDGV